ncbi:dipeptide ABC transporter ATP-binding protein [Herbidospora cretacea]|uniref:dipeptide ABC transporter ATP-binding protein n=1 Tax=Herbidospora cretacea TaxID=28444 RepID=UPI000774C1A5|nr:ABC transporter ATP-binding protein [Herbidospora cretacea]
MIHVEGLTVSFSGLEAVRDVSFTVAPGECLAIVGESGSGKSVTARALVGLAGDRAEVTSRGFTFDGADLSKLTETGWRGVRGRRIGLILQDALVSLDPLRTVGAEVAETLRTHHVVEPSQRPARVLELLAEAGIPDPEQRAGQHPHELSGGLRQRALIASVVAAGPSLLVADEPTTALDATVQVQILELLGRLKREGAALLLISHDLAAVARLADRVAVMYAGRFVEEGPAEELLAAPAHPYTRALIAAVPAAHAKGTRLSAPVQEPSVTGPALPARIAALLTGYESACPYVSRCALADQRCREEDPSPTPVGERRVRCHHHDRRLPDLPPISLGETRAPGPVLLSVENVTKRFGARTAVDDVSLELRAGETLGVVGESGSGKTTVARIALGLLDPDAGTVRLDGEPWSGIPDRLRRARRRRIQAIYQDPLGSFDPRHTAGQIIGEAVALPRRVRKARVAELLDQVGLPATLHTRRPLEMSGGQRQRVAIARALATGPEVLVCDEPVSALDVSIQAQILDLLATLQRDLAVAVLFISHDLGVIHHVSDRIAVMKDGRVVESGATAEVFGSPKEPYTKELLAAVPTLATERSPR